MKEVPALHAPAMFGLLRPVICLPKRWQEELTDDQLDWVLRHEVAHVKGRDGLLLSIATLARSCQWFNPLSWVAVSKLKQNMERAADELATRHLNEMQVREYGELLLRFAAGHPSKRPRPTIGLLAMAAPRGLQHRIESLGMPVKKRGWLRGLMALTVVGMVGVCGLTDAKQIIEPVVVPRPVPNFEVATAQWQHQMDSTVRMRETEPGVSTPMAIGAKQTVSIDVSQALAKARELQPNINAKKFVVLYFAPYTVQPHELAESKIVDGVLTVEVTEAQETLMRQMLSAFEKSGLWQIVTELKVIETDIRLLDQFDWSNSDSSTRFARLERAPVLNDPERLDEATLTLNNLIPQSTETEDYPIKQSAYVPIRATKISRLQSERFIRQMQKDPRSNLMQAPKVTMFNGQCAAVSNVTQRPFVTDVFEVAGDKATAFQPKISLFEDGWKFLIKPTVSGERAVNLQMVFSHASIDGVKLAGLPNRRGAEPDERVTIQVPIVSSDSIAVETELRESETLLVFSPKPYVADSEDDADSNALHSGQVFMIRTQLLSDSETLESFVPKQDRE